MRQTSFPTDAIDKYSDFFNILHSQNILECLTKIMAYFCKAICLFMSFFWSGYSLHQGGTIPETPTVEAERERGMNT